MTKSDIGRAVEFSGYDGKSYNATIADYRRGIAKLEYAVRSSCDGEPHLCVAYIPRTDHHRIQHYSGY